MAEVALDPDQRDAVTHRDGPCLVLAGPGSGKTRVVVERFLTLMHTGVPPAAQLVLTYTRRAAAEMRSRAEAAVDGSTPSMPLMNYHSFAQQVVREWGWLVGISPAYRIADDAERWLHVEAVLADLRPRGLWNPLRPHDVVDAVLDVIGKAKQELVTPQRYAAWASDALARVTDPAQRALLERQQEVAAVYAALDERYLRSAVLDHDDTILHAERLLREQDAVRHAVRDAITHVMVDEYQDTNYAQARLVETLVEDHDNILVVADDDQAIYKFRGASLANLERFTRRYPSHRRVTLSHNYRSTPQVTAAAAAVIGAAEPHSRIAKTLVSERPDGPAAECWEAPDERSEMTAIAKECRRLIDSGVRAADIALLFRRHADMRPAVAAMRENGVPYQVHGGRGYFSQPEVKDLLALLLSAADPDDAQATLRCLHLPAWGISARGRRAIVQQCADAAVTVADVASAPPPTLDQADATALARCVDDVLALHAMSAREDARDVFQEALARSEFLGILDEKDELARLQIGANLNRFGELLESFSDWSDDRRLTTVLRYLEVLRNSRHADEIAPIDPVDDGVVLLTAHSAKGLEWPVVIVPCCTEGRWPGRGGTATELTLPADLVPETPPAGDAALDEERRLFYVAVTRARDRLVLTRARRYARSYRDEPASPFVVSLATGASVAQREVERAAPLRPAAPRPRGPARTERLRASVSDLQAFRRCPRRYEYRVRYRMPAPVTLQSWFGTLIHRVLHNAATRRLAGEQVSGESLASTWSEAWRSARGFKGSHPELLALGEDQLRAYAATPAWSDASISAAEESFALAVDRADVTGRWDRLDVAEDRLTVVDYKTGPPPADATRLRGDLQVRAYAAAASRRERTDRVRVELHHLQTAEVSGVDFTRDQLETAYRHVSATAADLAAAWASGEFPPQPSAWSCPRCEYRTVCDEGRRAGD